MKWSRGSGGVVGREDVENGGKESEEEQSVDREEGGERGTERAERSIGGREGKGRKTAKSVSRVSSKEEEKEM